MFTRVSSTTVETWQSGLVLQKITGSAKPFCRLVAARNSDAMTNAAMGDSCIVKGPFALPRARPQMLMSAFRSELLGTLWNNSVSGPFELFCDENEEYGYIKMPNLGTREASANAPPKDEKVLCKHVDSNGVEQKYKTMPVAQVATKKSQGIVELSVYLKNTPVDAWKESIVRDAALHYVCRFVANIGDCALRNVLLVENTCANDDDTTVFGIDFEDTRSATALCGTVSEMLRGGKRWSAVQTEQIVRVLLSNGAHVLKLLDRIDSSLSDGHTMALIEKFGVGGSDAGEEMCRRMKQRSTDFRARFMLEKNESSTVTVRPQDGKVSKASGLRRKKSDAAFPDAEEQRKPKKARLHSSSANKNAAESQRSEEQQEQQQQQQQQQQKQNDDERLRLPLVPSEMVVQYRNNVSWCGHKQKVLISALQKLAGRRGIGTASGSHSELGAFYVAVQLDMFSTMENDDQVGSAASSVVTNFLNRLRVIMFEDVSLLSVPGLLVAFDEHYRKYIEARESGDPKQRKQCRIAVLAMISLMIDAKKCRLPSDIKMVFFTDGAHAFATEQGYYDQVYGTEATMHYLDPDVVRRNVLRNCLGVFPYGAAENRIPYDELQCAVDGFVSNIKRKSDYGFIWIDKLLRWTLSGKSIPRTSLYMGVGTRRRSTTNAMHLLFAIGFLYAKGELLWARPADASPASSVHSAVQLAEWFRSIPVAPEAEHAPSALLDKTLTICLSYFNHFGATPGKTKPHRDNILFAIVPALYLLRNVDWKSGGPIKQKQWTRSKAKHVYALSLSAKLPIEEMYGDFILDMHTNAHGKGKHHFVTKGAKVNNEDISLRNDAYRRLYVEFKSQ